jgi:hypothetical protein
VTLVLLVLAGELWAAREWCGETFVDAWWWSTQMMWWSTQMKAGSAPARLDVRAQRCGRKSTLRPACLACLTIVALCHEPRVLLGKQA